MTLRPTARPATVLRPTAIQSLRNLLCNQTQALAMVKVRAHYALSLSSPFMLLMGHLDVQMSEGLATDSNIKQDSTTPAPGRTN